MTPRTVRRRGPVVVALVVGALTLAACGGPGEPSAERASQATEAVDAPTPGSAAEATPDLAAFVPIDRAAWAEIDRSPSAAAGELVVVYAVVTQVYVAAGGTYAAAIATSPPASAAEGTPAILRGDPDAVGPVAPGDVLRVHAEVAGAYAGTAGGSVLLPELRLVATEQVPPYDLSADVTLGAPVVGAMSTTVPVTALNSADTAMELAAEVVAVSADGATLLASRQARIGVLEPGQSTTVQVRLSDLPPDAQLSLAGVTRALPASP